MTTLKHISLLGRIRNIIQALCAYILSLVVFVVFFVPCLILMCFPERYRRDSKLLFWFLDKTMRGFLWASLITIRIHGRHYIPQEASIFIANHESSLDIPILGSLAQGHPQVWFALDFYLKFPVLGFVIKRIAIPVARGDTPRAARALVSGVRLLEGQNRHLMIFPEGGRFVDGTIHPFYPGFSFIAERTRRAVVPVYIHNAGKVLAPDTFIPDYRYSVTVEIGEPLYVQEGESGEAFSQRAHHWFVETQKKFS